MVLVIQCLCYFFSSSALFFLISFCYSPLRTFSARQPVSIFCFFPFYAPLAHNPSFHFAFLCFFFFFNSSIHLYHFGWVGVRCLFLIPNDIESYIHNIELENSIREIKTAKNSEHRMNRYIFHSLALRLLVHLLSHRGTIQMYACVCVCVCVCV